MRRVLLFAGIFLTVAPLGGTESLKINVSPAPAIAPANLRIRVTVQPNAMNRTVGVAAESEDYFRSSEVFWRRALEDVRGDRGISG